MTNNDYKESSVKAVRRSLAVLETISAQREIGIREVAKQMRLTSSTVHRLISTLESLGYVEQNPETLKYRASIKLFEIGCRVVGHLGLKEEARPILEDLAASTGEAIHLGVLDKGEVVYVDKIDSSQALRMVSGLGTRAPAHCTGIGKILLAFLPDEERRRILAGGTLPRFTPQTITAVDDLEVQLAQACESGFAIDNEDLYVGICSVAAAIRDHTCRAAAGISIAGPTLRITPERLSELGKIVKDAADKVSARLGYAAPAGNKIEISHTSNQAVERRLKVGRLH